MRKIIGFKLALKVREIQRRAKKSKLDLEAAGLGEGELQDLLDQAAKAIIPAVLFDTFSDPEDQSLLSPMPGLAYSLVLATLGCGLENLKDKSRQENPLPPALWSLVEESALKESLRFATSLIEDEAAKDSCELSPITPLAEPSALEAALRKLEGAKIGVSLSEGRLVPSASLAVSLSWLSKSKARGKSR